MRGGSISGLALVFSAGVAVIPLSRRAARAGLLAGSGRETPPHAVVAAAPLLTLAEAVRIAQEKSPDIRQARHQLDSALARKRQALAPSEPTLTFNFNDQYDPFSLASTASEAFQVTQPLGFPGRAWLNRSQLSEQADTIENQLSALKLQVATNVKTAYYNLQLAQENMKLNDDTRIAFERIEAIARRRYEGGQTTQVDYLNAQVALLSNQNDLTDLRLAERQARAQLNVLLWNPPEQPVQVEGIRMTHYPAIQLDQAIAEMLDHRFEIRAARHQATAAGKAYDLAWMSLLPDFQLTAGTVYYRQPYASPYASVPWMSPPPNGSGPPGAAFPTHTVMVGVQFTVPIWGLFNEREAIVGASHDRAAAEAALDVTYNQSKVALESAVDSVNALDVKIRNYESHLLPLSEQALRLALISYSAGKIDFLTLSDTAMARRTVRLGYASAIVSYLTNYATYGQLIGEDL